MRLLIAGGRDFKGEALFRAILDEEFHIDGFNLIVIHGACPTGADAMADAWAKDNGYSVVPYPADWEALGKAAGPIRNAKMITEGRPERAILFKGGKGTADLAKQLVLAGIPFRYVIE